MLDNSKTFAVDHDRDATPTDEVWTRFDEGSNRSLYVGPSHEIGNRNTLTVLRTLPTVVGNFKGTRKSSIKITTDKAVEGVDSTTTVQAPVIGTVSFSMPVGVTAADAMHLRERLREILDDQDFITRLTESLEI